MRADDTTSCPALLGTPKRPSNGWNRGFDWSRSRRMPDCWELALGMPWNGFDPAPVLRRNRRTSDGGARALEGSDRGAARFLVAGPAGGMRAHRPPRREIRRSGLQ